MNIGRRRKKEKIELRVEKDFRRFRNFFIIFFLLLPSSRKTSISSEEVWAKGFGRVVGIGAVDLGALVGPVQKPVLLGRAADCAAAKNEIKLEHYKVVSSF